MWLVKLLLGLAVIYATIVVLAFVAQTWLIFPTSLAARSAPALPPSAERLEVATADGSRLVGVHLPAEGNGQERALMLGFGGNAWNADTLGLYLRELYPEHPVAAFHYRGYAPSAGRPSARAILDDALVIHDELVLRLQPPAIVAVGLSLGGGPATRLAVERDVAGLILVTPFDSLEALARHHYPWLPVRPLLRHRMAVAETLEGSTAPTAIVTAERDTIVPAARAAPVADAARNLVMERQIRNVGHNDLYGSAEFVAAMREAVRRIEETAKR